MAGSRMKRIDRNRYKKTYPIYRGIPNNVFQSDKEVIIETQDIDFTNETSKTIELAEIYKTVPIVTVTPQGEDLASINVFISSVSLAAGVVTVVVEASSIFTGVINLQSIMIGS